ncbi:MAG: hypothetical protein AAF771_00430 [Pseudomonadota bacterium]
MIARSLAIVAGIALALPAAAERSQIAQSIARDVERLNLGVTVDDLDSTQVAALHAILNSNRSESDKRGLAKSVIGGRNSLRDLLFGNR